MIETKIIDMQKFALQVAAILVLTNCTGIEEKKEQNNSTGDKTIIAFGSCATQDSTNLVWGDVAAHNPDVFIWLGDNIYGDSRDLAVLQEKYARQKQQPAYQRFLESGVEVIGTWDDHDYGENDAGKEFPEKEGSKKLLLDFLDVSRDAAVYQHPGVYQSYTYGKEGRKVKVILLDTRWFRDSMARDTANGGYVPREDGTVLGDEQWDWLEGELNESTAQVHIIGSSIQVLSEEHSWEKWANFTDEHERLYRLIADANAPNTILISGDRHQAEVSRIKLEEMKPWLYDVTTSGMTHVFARDEVEPNAHRISPLIIRRNWAFFEIDWKETGPIIDVEIRGIGDSLYYEHTLEL